jgi:hypothetical protein
LRLAAKSSRTALEPEHCTAWSKGRRSSLQCSRGASALSNSSLRSGVSCPAFCSGHELSVCRAASAQSAQGEANQSRCLAALFVAHGFGRQRGLSVPRRPALGPSLPRLAGVPRSPKAAVHTPQAHDSDRSGSKTSGAVAYFKLMQISTTSLVPPRRRAQTTLEYKYSGRRAWPNPSVEATSNGIAPWPGSGRCATFPLPGQGAMPSAAPHVERYAPGSYARVLVKRHAQRVASGLCRNRHVGPASPTASLWVRV